MPITPVRIGARSMTLMKYPGDHLDHLDTAALYDGPCPSGVRSLTHTGDKRSLSAIAGCYGRVTLVLALQDKRSMPATTCRNSALPHELCNPEWP